VIYRPEPLGAAEAEQVLSGRWAAVAADAQAAKL
jgi:hypothetical protein